MALALTTFLHMGFSEVSVSCLCSSACSSALSLGAVDFSKPQKLNTAFLQQPGSSVGSAQTHKHRDEETVCGCKCEK